MNNSLQVFSNGNFSIRTTRDDNGKIWFVAKDVAEALDYNTDSSMSTLFNHVPEIWTARKRITVTSDKLTARPYQDMFCLSEQGLYFFLGRSDKPRALPYQMWIANEVVPSIVHTGSYSLNKDNQDNPALPSGVIDGAKIIFETAGIKDNQLTLALDKVYRSYTGRSALQAGEIELVAPENKQLLTPTEIGQQLGITPRRVNEILAGAGFQYKINGKWEPLGNGINYAVMLDTNKKHSDGTPVRQVKWHSGIITIIRELIA